ncbi:Protein of unknown function [Lactobacillus delbrueckii subsp. bulgaricus]|nr:Protein of unknown function [Lactobacillus delbrueckii subsp. bulgaricus]
MPGGGMVFHVEQ